MSGPKYEPCDCPPDTCLKTVEPPSDCINRLTGIVEATRCEKCNGETFHHNGECIRCQRLAATPQRVEVQPPASPPPVHAEKRPSLTLHIRCGDEFLVTDKKTVSKILKILLED